MERQDGVQQSSIDSIFPSDFHVMLIDDDQICSSYVAKILKECNFKVTECDPSAALGVLQANKDTFSLVIIKVHLSDTDAFGLLEQTRKTSHIPALMLTMVPSEGVYLRCFEYQDCYHIFFPINVTKLISFSYYAFTHWNPQGTLPAKQPGPLKLKLIATVSMAKRLFGKMHKGESSGSKDDCNYKHPTGGKERKGSWLKSYLCVTSNSSP